MNPLLVLPKTAIIAPYRQAVLPEKPRFGVQPGANTSQDISQEEPGWFSGILGTCALLPIAIVAGLAARALLEGLVRAILKLWNDGDDDSNGGNGGNTPEPPDPQPVPGKNRRRFQEPAAWSVTNN